MNFPVVLRCIALTCVAALTTLSSGAQTSPTNQFIEAPVLGNPFTGAYSTIATADFNRDGKSDLLVINQASGGAQSMAVLLGNNKNQYTSKTVSDSASEPLGDSPQVADMNGDGIPDIVTASQGARDDSGNFTTDGAINIYFGKGDGTFQNHTQIAVGQYATPYLVDVNGDGKPDLVVATFVAGSTTASGVQAFLNNGHGVLTPGIPLVLYDQGYEAVIVAAGDITHSGSIDLIAGPLSTPVASPNNVPYQVVVGSKTGTFHLGQTLPYTLNAAVTFRSPVADYNGDGYADFPIINGRNNSIVMLTGSKAGTLSAASVTYLPENDNLGQLAGGDFNGDGKPDLAYSVGDPDPVVEVFQGLGNGKLSSPRVYTERRDFGGVLAGDFNGDGKTDLIAGSATLLLNDGKGDFPGPVVTQTQPRIPDSSVAADFNHDGIPDVAVNTCDGHVEVFTGTGLGYYNAPAVYNVAALGGLIAAGDVNGDGITDLVVLRPNDPASACPFNQNASPELSVLFGKADGTFAAALNQKWIPTGPGGPQYPRSIFLADFNNDGKLDLVGNFGVAFGNGDGTFSYQGGLNIGDGSTIENITVADFNHDGFPDLAVCIYELSGPNATITEFVRVFQNDGHGTLSPHGDILLGGLPLAVASADVTGDGKLDLLISAATPSNADPPPTGLYLAKGNGDGTFGAATLVASNPNIGLGFGLEVADFDRDGILDVVASGGGEIVYIRGTGGGAFENPAAYELPSLNRQLLVTDVDAGNGPDVLVLNGLGFTRLINTGH